jgi:hypothetical protein
MIDLSELKPEGLRLFTLIYRRLSAFAASLKAAELEGATVYRAENGAVFIFLPDGSWQHMPDFEEER